MTTAGGAWTIRDATNAEVGDWDALVRQNPDGGQWVQSSAYAQLKRTERLHPRHLVVEGAETAYALALEHRSLAGRFWYFPTGPGISFNAKGQNDKLKNAAIQNRGGKLVTVAPKVAANAKPEWPLTPYDKRG